MGVLDTGAFISRGRQGAPSVFLTRLSDAQTVRASLSSVLNKSFGEAVYERHRTVWRRRVARLCPRFQGRRQNNALPPK